jgi:hypothetical protein
MGIHINHLSLFVVGGGHIFVGYIAVLSERIKSRVEVLCRGEKITSTGVVEVGLQALFDVLCLENLNDLLSLDDIPVGSIHAETVYRLIAVVVSEVKRSQERIVVHAFLGRFDTTGTAISTMQNTSYPKYQSVELSAPVLTAAHGLFYFLLDIVITVFDILLGSVTGQVQYRFLTAPILLSFQELMNKFVILLPDLF